MRATASMRQIHEGMKVIDSSNEEIGKVELIRFGDDDPETPELEAAGGSRPERRDTLLDNIARAFRVDELPEEVRDRLLHQGFIRVDMEGLFAADRYITPEQIGSVDTDADAVTLRVSRTELLKRH